MFVAKCHVMNVVCELAEDILRRRDGGSGAKKQSHHRVSSFEQLVRRWNIKTAKKENHYKLQLHFRAYFEAHMLSQHTFFLNRWSIKKFSIFKLFYFFDWLVWFHFLHVAGCLWGRRGYQVMAGLMNFVLFLIANSYTILMGKYRSLIRIVKTISVTKIVVLSKSLKTIWFHLHRIYQDWQNI